MTTPGSRGVLVLVDDEPDIRTIASMALAQLGGWSVLEAGDGTAALEMITARPPDLVLLDVMLPDTDGPSVFSQLRRQASTRHVPVIFMTARTQAHERARYADLGALGVIEKPFDPMQLAAEIDRLLAQDPGTSAHELPELEQTLQRFRSRLPARIAELQAAIERVRDDDTPEHEARGLAHRLAGTAGSYGHAEVSTAARRLELALSTPVDWPEVDAALHDLSRLAEP